MALYCSPNYQTCLNQLAFWFKKFNIDFQDGGHLGFPIRTIFATLIYKSTNLQLLQMKSGSTLPFWFRRKSSNRFSTRLPGKPSWIFDQNDFSYF